MRIERAGMLAWVGLVCLAAGVVLWAGCGDDDTTKPPEELAPPSNLRAINGPDYVEVIWDASSSAGLDDFQGYNVYRHTASLRDTSVTRLQTYRLNSGDPVTTDLTSYNDETAELGTRYYYMVRAVKGGDANELSEPVEIHSAPRDEGGPVTIAELKHTATGEPSALNLAEQTAVGMRDENMEQIDVYLGTTDANDTAGQPLALKSPHLVVSLADWSSRTAKLYDLGTGTTGGLFLTEWEAPPATDEGWVDMILLASPADKVIAVLTPPDDQGQRHYAKLHIQSLITETGGRKILIDKIAYQPIPDYPRFVRSR